MSIRLTLASYWSRLGFQSYLFCRPRCLGSDQQILFFTSGRTWPTSFKTHPTTGQLCRSVASHERAQPWAKVVPNLCPSNSSKFGHVGGSSYTCHEGHNLLLLYFVIRCFGIELKKVKKVFRLSVGRHVLFGSRSCPAWVAQTPWYCCENGVDSVSGSGID